MQKCTCVTQKELTKHFNVNTDQKTFIKFLQNTLGSLHVWLKNTVMLGHVKDEDLLSFMTGEQFSIYKISLEHMIRFDYN